MRGLALWGQAGNEPAAEQSVEGWLRYLTELGAWDLISIGLALAGIIGVSLWLFVPRRRVPGLNVFVTSEHGIDVTSPARMKLEIRNFSGSPVLIRRATFKFSSLRPDARCPMHTETQECEIKFPGRVPGELCEPDSYLRQGGCVLTWIALDGSHTPEEVRAALDAKRVGTLACSIVHLGEKAQLFELKTRC